MVIEKVKCPHCGYLMPVEVAADAVAKGLFVKCKGRSCNKTFEIRINEDKVTK